VGHFQRYAMQIPMQDPEIVYSGPLVTDLSAPSDSASASLLYWLTLSLLSRCGQPSSFAAVDLPQEECQPAMPCEAPQRLIDVLPGIVFQAAGDAGWSMRYLSAGCYALTGYRPEELLGPDSSLSYNAITHPDDLERVLTTIQQAIDRGQPYEVKYRIQTRDGTLKWVWEKGATFLTPTGAIDGIEGFITDITPLKQSESALRLVQQTLKQREQILATLAEIQRQLLAWRWDWQDVAITQVFAALGEISGASRVYYYEIQGDEMQGDEMQNYETPGDEMPGDRGSPLKLCQRIEWSIPGVVSLVDHAQFQTLPIDPLFTDWYAQLSQHQFINLVEAEFSSLQRQVLGSDPCGVKSLLLLPVVVKGELFGVIGFSNCTAPRPWTDAEIDLLRVVAADMALALERRQSELSLKQAEAKYRSIFENSVEGMFQTTPAGQYLTVNAMLAKIYGYDSPAELIDTLTDINQQLYVQPGRRQEFVRLMQLNGAVLGFESEVYRKDGSAIWISESARAIYGDRQVLLGYEGTVENITDRKRGEAAILRRDRLLQGVAEASQCLLTTVDINQALPQVLSRLGEAATADRAYVYAHHPHAVTGAPAMTMHHEWTAPGIDSSIDQPHWQGQSYGDLGLERWYTTFQRGGSICALTRHLPPVEQALLKKDNIQSILMVPIFIDATLWGYIGFDACQREWEWNASDESILVAVAASLGGALQRQLTEAQMCYQVYHDTLTGLPNRAFFDHHLPEAIARTQHTEQRLAVIFLDLDNFKTINDTLSHAVGDQLLQQVTQRMSAALRSEDIVARWGGDEFTLILPNLASAAEAANIAQRIADQLTPPFLLHNHELHVTASIGIAVFPEDGQDMTTLLQNADAAMYRAKQQGRNTIQFYTQSLSTEAAQRLKLETYLHHALDRDEFILHYQPQVDVTSGTVVQMEALLRWQHPSLGLVAPCQFIPLAEENGLIVPIGEWVLHQACSQVMAWHRAGLPLVKLAVNLSARQLQHPNLVATVEQVLADTGLPVACLELEITETAAMADMAASIARLRELRHLGVKISMDECH
jgi:diguanylate cyclase (GGDEF)-like protein/PAS domain S-box-containing protein